MSDLVYTQFGYGKVETPSKPKVPESKVQKDQDQPKPEEPQKPEIQTTPEDNTQESSEDKIVKVAFKWGGSGFLPVPWMLTKGKLSKAQDQGESQDLLRPQKGLRAGASSDF